MLVLGWHGSLKGSERGDPARFEGHDAAAVLLKDGVVVAAVEEERLNRLKHSNAFPVQAIRHCLSEAGVRLSDVDMIITDHLETTVLDVAKRQHFYNPGERPLDAHQWIARLFDDAFATDVSSKISFCAHHRAHMYAAWYTSGYPDALGVCLDAGGDGRSGLVAMCEAGGIRTLRDLPYSASLGMFYIGALNYLGYSLFDEYKVMGLAPYGDPSVYASFFERLYSLGPDGQVEVQPIYDLYRLYEEAGLTGRARRHGEGFTQDHKDYAAALQKALERMCWHVIGHFADVTGARRLCLTGGVAQNCTMNGEIVKARRFDAVHVQPAAHDAGNALGAALSALHDSGAKLGERPFSTLYLGRDIGTSAQVAERLAVWADFLVVRQSADVHAEAAGFLAAGDVIGWVQGRSEFGPRALGNRSILADPRPAENKTVINAMIKKREGYRPFAPSVLQERLHDYFEMPDPDGTTPFMVLTLPVREPFRALLGAVTHVDGSARVQSVAERDNPDYHRLISRFADRTGLPILLNTSFNNNVEPIVDSVDDAVACFLTTDLHKLVIADWIIEKALDPPLLTLAARLSAGWRMSASGVPDEGGAFVAEPTAAVLSGSRSVAVSHAVFHLLTNAGGSRALSSRCATAGVRDSNALAAVAAEIRDLWERRVVTLTPSGR